MHVSTLLAQKGRHVVTMPGHEPLAEAARIMREENIGAVVILGLRSSLAGLISERDILRAIAKRGPEVLYERVEDHMTRVVVTCAPRDAIQAVMRAMTLNRVRHVPVVKGETLLGLVSIGDVVKYRIDELEAESTLLRRYVMTG